MHKPLKIKQ